MKRRVLNSEKHACFIQTCGCHIAIIEGQRKGARIRGVEGQVVDRSQSAHRVAAVMHKIDLNMDNMAGHNLNCKYTKTYWLLELLELFIYFKCWK